MSGRLFGTDGVRGLAGRELTEPFAFELGRAAGRVLAEERGAAAREGPPVFVVARDTRASGPGLLRALAGGLRSAGAEVVGLGVAPTPAVSHLVPVFGARAGAVVSASHNPAEYNGIKFLDEKGRKLEEALEDAIEAALPPREAWGAPGAGGGAGSGNASDGGTAPLEPYLRHLLASLDGPFSGERVVLDCANGAAVRTAPEVFRRAGLSVTVLGDRPDGRNINLGCGSQHPEVLARAVVAEGAVAGFAFDGDADRCIAVDEAGRTVDGDGILAVLALDLLARGRLPGRSVVATVMSNLGLERALAERGIALVRVPVGDRHVAAAMEAGGHGLGGEQSGHVVIRDFAATGDGVLTALQVLCAMRRAGRTLGEMASVLARLPQEQRNLRIPEGRRLGADERMAIAAIAERAEERLAGRGRVVVRPSGTEPVVRILVEGDDEREVAAQADELAEAISRELSSSARARGGSA